MPLWRLYYHFVWATKDRHPLITTEVEKELYGYIVGKAHALGCITHAIGGIEDHIHIVASVPPKLSLTDYVQKIKGSSAYHLNHTSHGWPAFKWQRGYGVFSLGRKQLAEAITYVLDQKVHHREGSLIPALERFEEIDDRPVPWHDERSPSAKAKR